MARNTAERRVGLNADEEAGKRTTQDIVIGGRVFHARKKSGKLMEEWIEITPEDTPKQGESEGEDGKASASHEEMKDNVRNVYEQVAVLIAIDPESDQNKDKTPSVATLQKREKLVEFLYDDELDIEEATRLIERLAPPSPKEEMAARGKQD